MGGINRYLKSFYTQRVEMKWINGWSIFFQNMGFFLGSHKTPPDNQIIHFYAPASKLHVANLIKIIICILFALFVSF